MRKPLELKENPNKQIGGVKIESVQQCINLQRKDEEVVRQAITKQGIQRRRQGPTLQFKI